MLMLHCAIGVGDNFEEVGDPRSRSAICQAIPLKAVSDQMTGLLPQALPDRAYTTHCHNLQGMFHDTDSHKVQDCPCKPQEVSWPKVVYPTGLQACSMSREEVPAG